MSEELRAIRAQEASADSVYARSPEQSLSETPTQEQCPFVPKGTCTEFDCPVCSYEQ